MSEAAILAGPSQNEADVHWLPFGISYNGPANVSKYFAPASEPLSSQYSQQTYTATFRGRRLKGVQRQLPTGYQGVVLKPCKENGIASVSDAEQRSWQTCNTFQQLTLWNHDTAPAATDLHNRCLDWLALADQLHEPIQPADVEQELQLMQEAGVRADA